MLRHAALGAWFFVAVSLACGGPPPPEPTKVSDAKNLLQTQPAPPPRTKDSPFRNPDKEPPPPRSEPQLPAEELAAVLAEADAAREVRDNLEAYVILRRCANRVPQSVRCEGELAALLATMPHHRHESKYYLEQAIAGDDPELPADYYRRLGEALRHKGMFNEAVIAYERMLVRIPTPTATDQNLLAEALQAAPKRELEAAAAVRKAYELDPTRHEWLRDEALLLAQVPETYAQAIERFELLKTRVTTPNVHEEADRMIATLRRQLAPATPTKPNPTKKPPRDNG